MSVIGSNILAGAAGQGGGYVIDNSLRLRSSASAYLNRTPATAGNQKTWTWSGWLKRGTVTTDQIFFAIGNTYIRFGNGATDNIWLNLRGNGATNYFFKTAQLFRDPSAWYHIVLAVDTTQATASNRVKLYVNGVVITSFDTYANAPPQNADTGVNSTSPHALGSSVSPTSFFDGYLTEINLIDGQALTPSSFGDYNEDTGVWQPAKYAGTYGTNGFYLNFSNNTTTTTLAEDSSENGNNWTPNNISLTAGVTYDSMTDTPTPYAAGGNYAVLNPLNKDSQPTISNGNLNVSMGVAAGGWRTVPSTIAMPDGKWYAEVIFSAINGSASARVGIAATSNIFTGNVYPGLTSTSYSYGNDGPKYNNNGTASYGASWTTGDILGIAFDSSTGTLTFYKNNVSQGVAYASISSADQYYIIVGGANVTNTCAINFGQRPFAYTPPTGFKSLHTGNLPDVAIENGSEYFAATTYTGNGGTQSISNDVNGVSFQPDWVWVKRRDTAASNLLFDSIRGIYKRLVSDATTAEVSDSDTLTAFNSNGFSSGNGYGINVNAATYVGWQWKAGGAAVTNTAGSITSQVSASPTAGFSIVTYTGNGTAGATAGHSLGVAPSMVIVKCRSSAGENWPLYHASLGNANAVFLNTTAQSQALTYWNSTTPSSTVFTLGSNLVVNRSAATFVAYCFAEVPGYSSFGSYVGNGSSDGVFVYLGFRPAFVMIKRSSGVDNWAIFDTSRLGYNPDNNELLANTSSAEGTADFIDIVSNGFKNRNADTRCNASGSTYIYMAFAENPFKNSLAR
jgi:hypothetical protein